MCSSATRPRTAALIQARHGSTRLPGKVLLELVEGRTVLGYLLDRLGGCALLDAVVVAIPDTPENDALADWLAARGQGFVRGSEADCLGRAALALAASDAELVLRITSDCPLVPPDMVDDMLRHFLANRERLDYLSNRQFTNFPEGTDVEVFHAALLREAAARATDMREREHINHYFLDRPERFRLRYFTHGGADHSRFKLSIDTEADLLQARSLFAAHGLPRNFTLSELFSALARLDAAAPERT